MSLATLFAAAAPLAVHPEDRAGLAWQVHGTWHSEGNKAAIAPGDPIRQGVLLRTAESGINASITVLLPDGQRVLFECFTAEDCARGFRVPLLYREPEPFAIETLTRIRAALEHEKSVSSDGSGTVPPLPRDEAVSTIGADNKVQIKGLAARLPEGHYTYDLQPLDAHVAAQSHVALDKTESAVTLTLPGPGLYKLSFTDDLNSPRIDVFLAALTAGQSNIQQSFQHAKEMMGDWNENYYGWPLHDFERAYLESYFIAEKPQVMAESNSTGAKPAVASKHATAAEPEFTPIPGVFTKDLEVTLHCKTPGAILHFTVDGSQPVAASPVYAAPIIVKGTELTIKSFAAAPGKKDSPVVTGIFRIHE